MFAHVRLDEGETPGGGQDGRRSKQLATNGGLFLVVLPPHLLREGRRTSCEDVRNQPFHSYSDEFPFALFAPWVCQGVTRTANLVEL